MCTPSRKRFLTNFFILNISVISATKVVFRKNLKQMKGEKGERQKAGEVGKERQRKEQEKESESEGKSTSCNKCSWVSSAVHVLGLCGQGKEVTVSAPAYSPVFSPQGFLMKNSYTNTWSVFTNTAEKQRKMKTGVLPRGISQEFLAYFLSVSYAHRRKTSTSWQNRDPKKEKKETHQALWSLVSSCTLFGPCLLSRWWKS